MNEKFADILDKDEQIVAVLKPNKTKFWWSNILVTFFVSLMFLIPVSLGVGPGASSNTHLNIWLVSGIFAGGLLLVLVFIIWFGSLSYSKKFYAYTNKRILIRSGIFGVDYRALDYKLMGALTVNVSLFDKIIRKNTGSIQFGSASSPIGGSGGNLNLYVFCHIEKPYEVLRQIKETANTLTDKDVK